MKQKRQQKNWVGSIWIGVVILIGIFSFFQLEFAVNQALYNTVFNLLHSTAVEQQYTVNLSLQTTKNDAVSIAKTVEGKNEMEILTHLQEQQSIFQFDGLYFMDRLGNGMSADGNLAATQVVEKLNYDTESVMVTKPYQSVTTGNTVIGIQAPVFYEQVVIGYVLVEYDTTPMMAHLAESLAESGHVIITDAVGNDFLTTTEDFVSREDLREAEFTDSAGLQAVQNALAAHQEGSVSFVLDGVPMTGIFKPLNINDWSIVLVVNENEVTREVQLMSIIVVGALFVVFIVLIILIVNTTTGKRRVEEAAYYDDLTGLPNLMKLKRVIRKQLRTHPKRNYAVIKMDVASFKSINEMFGFATGNKVLLEIANSGKRMQDPSFVMARVGGDDFMMFCSRELGEKLTQDRHQFEQYVVDAIPALNQHKLKFRYGRYFVEQGETDVNEIINKLHLAHSFAKNSGSEGVFDYDDTYKQQLLINTEITNQMEPALKNHEMVPFLQPKFRLSDGCLIGAEALVRWIKPDGKMIFPDQFIPLFESNGFVVQLDQHMLDCICVAFKDWSSRGYPCVPVSINFSRRHLSNPNFVAELVAIVDRHEVPHRYIEIELTETTILNNEERLGEVLADLHEAGFRVSIDDFGAGYSSLGMLKSFVMDTIKLDRSFLMTHQQEDRGHLVIDGIIKLAHSLNMDIVAEGVEEQAQVTLLKEMGCEYGQGYFFAKPIPLQQFTENYMEKPSADNAT